MSGPPRFVRGEVLLTIGNDLTMLLPFQSWVFRGLFLRVHAALYCELGLRDVASLQVPIVLVPTVP